MTPFTIIGWAFVLFCAYRFARAAIRREMTAPWSFHWEPAGNRSGEYLFGLAMHFGLLLMAILVLTMWIRAGV